MEPKFDILTFFSPSVKKFGSLLLSGGASYTVKLILETFFSTLPDWAKIILMAETFLLIACASSCFFYIREILSKCRDLYSKNQQAGSKIDSLEKKCNELENINSKPSDDTLLLQALQKFVDGYEICESTQLYRFNSISESKVTFCDKDITQIDIHFDKGYAGCNVDLNTIFQTTFYFETSVFREVYTFFQEFNKYYIETNKPTDPLLQAHIEDDTVKIIDKLTGILNDIDDQTQIKNYHYSYYRILMVLHSIVAKNRQLSVGNYIKNSVVEDQLLKGKKTGLLGTIFMDSMYCFNNQRSMIKRDRIYVTFPAYIKGKNYLVLCSVSKDSCRYRYSIDEIQKDIYDKFKQNIKETLNN